MVKKIIYCALAFLVFTFSYILSFWIMPKYFFDVPLLGPIGVLLFLSLLLFVVLKLAITFSFDILDVKDAIITSLLFFFINYNIYGMIPFNTSRSNSILIIGYLLQNEGNPKSKTDIEYYVKKMYFDKYDAIGKRLEEQETAGNIINTNGKYCLSERGKLITKLFSYISDLYRTNSNFAKPQ